MDIDALLDKHAKPPCAHSIHKQPPDKQALLKRAREREAEGIPNPDLQTLADLSGVSMSSVRRFMRSGCACES
jgi:hypothetical protein